MYYDNKSAFYFKQYALPIIALVISVTLIGIGIYVYWASSAENAEAQNLVNTNTTQKDEESLTANQRKEDTSDDKKDTENMSLFIEYINSLQPLEKSTDIDIVSVDDSAIITVDLNGEKKELVLIGIDYDNTSSEFIQTLKNDLSGKKVKLSFDISRLKDNKIQAYVYLDNNMYNESILEKGLAKYKSDGTNKKCEKTLKEAQTYAKQLKLGVWAK